MSRSILDFSKECSKANLLDPRCPLSSKELPSTIAATNTEVMHLVNSSSKFGKIEVLTINQSKAKVEDFIANIRLSFKVLATARLTYEHKKYRHSLPHLVSCYLFVTVPLFKYVL